MRTTLLDPHSEDCSFVNIIKQNLWSFNFGYRTWQESLAGISHRERSLIKLYLCVWDTHTSRGHWIIECEFWVELRNNNIWQESLAGISHRERETNWRKFYHIVCEVLTHQKDTGLLSVSLSWLQCWEKWTFEHCCDFSERERETMRNQWRMCDAHTQEENWLPKFQFWVEDDLREKNDKAKNSSDENRQMWALCFFFSLFSVDLMWT